jgi:type IV pilus assembly protein PilY1
MKVQRNLVIRALLGTALLLVTLSNALAAAPLVISNTPLATSSPTQVQPNIFYVLDDSGSMSWDFLPDTVGTDNTYNSTPQLIQNNSYNGVYYDPSTTYTPPSTYNSSYSYTTNSGGYPSMSSTNSAIAGWTKVPYDGFGVQKATDPNSTGVSNLFTSSTSGTTQNLTASGVATYYTFTPGEYCQDFSQHTCVAQTAPSPSYPYAAYVRWCSSSALTTTTCEATRFDTAIGGKT